MVCGLFSSFDPGILPESGESSFIHLKWVYIGSVFMFFNWQIFSLSSGKGLVMDKIVNFVNQSVKELSLSPEKVGIILLSLFLTIFSMNLSGLIPLFFSLSSHLSVNLALSLTLWSGGIIYSLCNSFTHLLAHLVPLGSPIFLWPLLVLVESVSMIIRPFTLSIRLMANVMAGHMIMSLMGQGFSMSEALLPLSFVFLGFFLVFEMCISGVQAYVFMKLLSLYWEESEH